MKKVTLLLAIGALFLGACTSKKESNQGASSLPLVKVAEAKSQMVTQIAEFTGNIEPYAKNSISSSASQRIEKIYVEVGTRVRKGQLLVQMENLNYGNAKTQIENLKIDMSRIDALYAAGGVSKQQSDQIHTQVKVAEESLRNLDKNTKLLSPIDGVVTQRNFDNGDLTMGQPILVVMQLQPVKIMVSISEEFFPRVKIGTPVEISLDIYEGQKFPGKVSLIYPTIDVASRTFQAQVSINNPKMEIRPGMFARAKVELGAKNRVVVPDKSVIKQQGTNDKYIYVLDGESVVFTKVEPGRRVGAQYEIISGIENGQKVVIAGMNNLVDKAKVEVTESGADLSL